MNISVNNLCFSYENHPVLIDVSFQCQKGDFLAILGPNGVGKTTLFRCLLGMNRDFTGEVLLDGRNNQTLSPKDIAKHMAYIPQLHTPSFGYTCMDMVLMGRANNVSIFSAPSQEDKAYALHAMETMGISRLANRTFNKLSCGEQQLVLIARALAQKPKILIMDEPASALDYGNQHGLMNIAKSLSQDGYIVLMVTHNPQHALWYTNKTLALSQGQVLSFGSTKEVINKEMVKNLYGLDVDFVHSNNLTYISPNNIL